MSITKHPHNTSDEARCADEGGGALTRGGRSCSDLQVLRARPGERAQADGVDLAEMFTALTRLKAELSHVAEGRLGREHDLTLSDLSAMEVIAERRGCSQDQVADALGISNLEARRRVAALRDRGVGWVSGEGVLPIVTLTLAGHRLLKQASAALEAELELHLTGRLSAADLDRFQECLQQLHDGSTQPVRSGRASRGSSSIG